MEAFWRTLTEQEKAELNYRWQFWARPDQLPPGGDWRTWLILAGRGWGKTRTGAEFVRDEIESGRCRRFALVARTAADARDVMVEGESGILAICPPWNRPKYEPSKRRITWPNGAIATTYSGDEPDLLRGPQHDGAWADEIAAWRYPETFDQLQFGLRLGANPRLVATTTPRPTPLIRRLVSDPTTHLTKGKTRDNSANLADAFLSQIIRRYEGTRQGRQELDGEILGDNPGALWKLSVIDASRVGAAGMPAKIPTLARVFVGVDPQAADPAKAETEEKNAETGIVAAGWNGDKVDPHFFILSDDSANGSPSEWGGAAVTSFDREKADRIVGEVNNGGAMVEFTIKTVAKDRGMNVPFEAVHASRGKQTRAEPISSLYDQGRVHHVGFFPTLEDQMCTWEPGMKSPDRMDALVWVLTRLAELAGYINVKDEVPAANPAGFVKSGGVKPIPSRTPAPSRGPIRI